MNQQVSVPSRRRLLDDASQGLGIVRGPHISMRGGRFRFVTAAGERLINTHSLDLIVVDANKHDARIFFEGEFDPNNMEVPPLCFSDNGTGPSKDSIQPQAPTCLQCEWARRGTDVTFTGKQTTACTRRKKLGVIEPDAQDLTVYELVVPPGSLSNFRAYTDWLGQQTHPTEQRGCDLCDVVTRIEFDPNKPFVMKYSCVSWADDEITLKKVEHIFTNDLGAAACGRTDVALDPALFRALPRPEPAQHLQAPAQQNVPQLPPRTSNRQSFPDPSLPAPTAAPTRYEQTPAPGQTLPPPNAAPAPRGRGRPRNQPAGTATAPFMAPAVAAGPVAAAPSPEQQSAQTEIPDFLRRVPDNSAANEPAAPARFGIAQAAPPPAEIQNAVNQAMQLPSRR